MAVHAGSRIGSLKEAWLVFARPGPFAPGGRTGKQLFRAVSPTGDLRGVFPPPVPSPAPGETRGPEHTIDIRRPEGPQRDPSSTPSTPRVWAGTTESRSLHFGLGSRGLSGRRKSAVILCQSNRKAL